MIDLFACIGTGLSVGFQHIKESQPDDAAQTVKAHGDAPENTPNAHEGADHHRKNAKAHDIGQRIQLDAVELLVIGAPLLGAGYLSVKGIKKAGQCKTYDGNAEMTVHGLCHAINGGKDA